MTVPLWWWLAGIYLVLAVAILWWGWVEAEDQGRVVPGEDHADTVRRLRAIEGGRR